MQQTRSLTIAGSDFSGASSAASGGRPRHGGQERPPPAGQRSPIRPAPAPAALGRGDHDQSARGRKRHKGDTCGEGYGQRQSPANQGLAQREGNLGASQERDGNGVVEPLEAFILAFCTVNPRRKEPLARAEDQAGPLPEQRRWQEDGEERGGHKRLPQKQARQDAPHQRPAVEIDDWHGDIHSSSLRDILQALSHLDFPQEPDVSEGSRLTAAWFTGMALLHPDHCRGH